MGQPRLPVPPGPWSDRRPCTQGLVVSAAPPRALTPPTTPPAQKGAPGGPLPSRPTWAHGGPGAGRFKSALSATASPSAGGCLSWQTRDDADMQRGEEPRKSEPLRAPALTPAPPPTAPGVTPRREDYVRRPVAGEPLPTQPCHAASTSWLLHL